MNSLSKFGRSWILFKSSVFIVLKHKKLLLFPVLTLLLTGVILVFFLTPIALQSTGHSYREYAHWKAVAQTVFVEDSAPVHQGGNTNSSDLHLKPLGMVYAGGIYFLSMLLATFFNVAFYHEILKALKGEAVSIRAGLSFACTKWKPILMWTLFAGLVGLIIRTLEERLSFIGQWIVGLIGLAWSVASVFVIPVIITEETTVNPLNMLKSSALTLKKTWGESLIGYVGLQFGSLLILLGSVAYFAVAVMASIWLNNFWILAVTGFLWLVGIIVFGYVTSVASQVYRCALFVYASEGTVPEPYNLELLQMAWKVKKS